MKINYSGLKRAEAPLSSVVDGVASANVHVVLTGAVCATLFSTLVNVPLVFPTGMNFEEENSP